MSETSGSVPGGKEWIFSFAKGQLQSLYRGGYGVATGEAVSRLATEGRGGVGGEEGGGGASKCSTLIGDKNEKLF